MNALRRVLNRIWSKPNTLDRMVDDEPRSGMRAVGTPSEFPLSQSKEESTAPSHSVISKLISCDGGKIMDAEASIHSEWFCASCHEEINPYSMICFECAMLYKDTGVMSVRGY